jgi:hypothetical protein
MEQEDSSDEDVVRGVLGKRARKALKRKPAADRADALAHSAGRSAAPTQAAADVVGIARTGAPCLAPNAAKKRESMIDKQQARAGVASNFIRQRTWQQWLRTGAAYPNKDRALELTQILG